MEHEFFEQHLRYVRLALPEVTGDQQGRRVDGVPAGVPDAGDHLAEDVGHRPPQGDELLASAGGVTDLLHRPSHGRILHGPDPIAGMNAVPLFWDTTVLESSLCCGDLDDPRPDGTMHV